MAGRNRGCKIAKGEEMEVRVLMWTYILDVLNALKCQQVRIRLTDEVIKLLN